MKIFGPTYGSITLQKSGNLFMDNIIYFHDLLLTVLFFILFIVTWFLFVTILYFGFPLYYQILELKFYIFLLKSLVYIKYKAERYFMKILRKVLRFFNIYYIPQVIYTFLHYMFNVYFYMYMYIKARLHKNETLYQFQIRKGIEYRYYFYSDVKLEFLWTVFPTLVLLFLAIPSFGLLFSIEKVSAPELTVKVIGHQWYWEYQYMDYIDFKQIVETNTAKYVYLNKKNDEYIIESYMIADDDLEKGQYRLLEVDKKLVLPVKTSIRLLITSDDVLHSWAVPSLGIKLDACPGRLNELIINIRDIGLYYGQCSELCGWYHGFMPIVIQSCEPEDFKIWSMSQFLDIKYVLKKDLEAYELSQKKKDKSLFDATAPIIKELERVEEIKKNYIKNYDIFKIVNENKVRTNKFGNIEYHLPHHIAIGMAYDFLVPKIKSNFFPDRNIDYLNLPNIDLQRSSKNQILNFQNSLKYVDFIKLAEILKENEAKRKHLEEIHNFEIKVLSDLMEAVKNSNLKKEDLMFILKLNSFDQAALFKELDSYTNIKKNYNYKFINEIINNDFK